MTGLPFGLTEPLHIEEPFPTAKLVLAGFLLWLAYRLLRRLLGRWRAKRAARPKPVVPALVVGSGFAAVIDEIRARAGGDYRRGCHELAAALRRHFGERHVSSSAGRHPFPTLTAREIARRVGDTALSRLFGLLAELQFYRREPSKSDFEGACELAIEVSGEVERGA